MKRVTILFDDESLYRDLKAEAAREGRPVKDVVAEAVNAWLMGRSRLTRSQREERAAALRQLDEIRARQPVSIVVLDLLDEIRNERP